LLICMKIRTIEATFIYPVSGKREVKTVTCLFSDRNEKYDLTMLFVVEFNQKLVFDKSDNSFLVRE
jgi:hypothetical protein